MVACFILPRHFGLGSRHGRSMHCDSGGATELARGLFRLTELPPLGQPDLVTMALKVRKGVLCLVSAPAFHELTTQIPHTIYLALPYGTTAPRLFYPLSLCAGCLVNHLLLESNRTKWIGSVFESITLKKQWPTASSSATRLAWKLPLRGLNAV